MKRIFLIAWLISASSVVYCQVLISLLLGDKLNSGTVEFGLDGGVNLTSLSGVTGANTTTGFFLGFYFDIKTKTPWLIHTGVIVKSPLGAEGMEPYSLQNPDLDNAFAGGEVTRKLSYFNVPIAVKRVFENNFFVEGGIQLGLGYKALDEFSNNVSSGDLTYEVSIRDQFHPLDAGPVAGIGYRLMKGNGMNINLRYYYGIVDITIDDTTANVYNRALYIGVGIPIGVGKDKARAASKETNQEN